MAQQASQSSLLKTMMLLLQRSFQTVWWKRATIRRPVAWGGSGNLCRLCMLLWNGLREEPRRFLQCSASRRRAKAKAQLPVHPSQGALVVRQTRMNIHAWTILLRLQPCPCMRWAILRTWVVYVGWRKTTWSRGLRRLQRFRCFSLPICLKVCMQRSPATRLIIGRKCDLRRVTKGRSPRSARGAGRITTRCFSSRSC